MVRIFCDNMAAVQVLGLDKSKDDLLAAYIKNIWLLTAALTLTFTYHTSKAKQTQ